MSIDRKNVCAVVVTYQPDTACITALLNAVLPQVGGLVVINNGQPRTVVLPEFAERGAGCFSVLDMERNLGVAAAQNRGIDWAKRHGYSHVILFDQDSEPDSDMVEKLLGAWSELTGSGLPVAAVGPKLVDRRDRRQAPFVTFGAFGVKRADCNKTQYVRADFLVSSGMLASIAVYEKVGMLDEGLFIDNVDLDWCFRARQQGLSLYGVCEASMLHQIGDAKICASVFGRTYPIYQHQPLRQYYIMRNRILLYRRAYSPYAWIVQDIVRAVGKGLVTLVFFSQRRLNFQMMLNGFVDGLSGKTGEYFSLR